MKSVEQKHSGIAVWIVTVLVAVYIFLFGSLFLAKSPTILLFLVLVIFLGSLAYSMLSAIDRGNVEQMVPDVPTSSRVCLYLNIASWVYPIVLIASFYGTWAIAWALLGHKPAGAIEGPDSFNVWVNILWTIGWLLVLGSPAALFGGLMWTAWSGVQRNLSRLKKMSLLFLRIAIWNAAFCFCLVDPWGVVNWFGD